MLKRTMAVVFAICFAMTVGSALAQVCSVGVYADEAGTQSVFQPTQNKEFDVHVVLFTENVVNALSYSVDIPGQNVDLFVVNEDFGPSANGINIRTVNGENVGLGECAIGFTGLPVLVATYTCVMPFPGSPARTITLSGNVDQDPLVPVYSTCQGELTPCDVGPTLVVDMPVATEATSFGAVKSLYSN